MPTYDIVMNIAKGRVAELAALGAAADALIAVPLETSGIVGASTMKDYATLAAVLAGATNEQTTMGRKTLASVAVAVDNTDDWQTADCADITWTAAAGNPVSALLICYDGDTGAGSDSDIIPLVCMDMVATPAGGDITYQVNSVGFFKAA